MTRTERVQQLSERFYVASTNLTPSEATALAEMAVAEMAQEVKEALSYGPDTSFIDKHLKSRGLKD